MHSIIAITGQTATGKTSYALKLARQISGELISADSRQIYKHLDIVTGKDLGLNDQFSMINDQRKSDKKTFKVANTPEVSESFTSGVKHNIIGYYLLNEIPVWLYDVVDPKTPFSSYDFRICAEKVIADITDRGKIPIIVGGAYLYIKHLLYGFETETIPPDWQLRKKLKNKTVEELADILRSTNEQMFKQLNISDRKNPQRLIRKIEIARVASTPEVSESFTSGVKHNQQRYTIAQFVGLKFKSREDLVATITKRVEERLQSGALEETQRLLAMGYTKTDPGLQTIGYTQLIDHLERNVSLEEATKQWITAEVQYARRQYTFMKTNPNISWILV